MILVNGALPAEGFPDLDRRMVDALGDGCRRLVTPDADLRS